MKRMISFCILWLCQLALFTQVGWATGSYLPTPPWVNAVNAAYTLTLKTSPVNAGSFNRNSVEQFDAGNSIYLRTYNNSGYTFDYWMSGDTIVSKEPYFYFTMPEHDAELTAVYHFDPSNPPNPDAPDNSKKYTLTLSAKPSNAGSFNHNSGEQYAAGENVYMYCYNNGSFYFDHWMSGDTIISTDRSFYFTMPEHDAELTAVYHYDPSSPANPDTAKVYYTVVLDTKPANAGSFSWNEVTEVVARSSCSIYAYNNTGYVFREWQQDGKTVGTDRRYSFQMPAENIHLTAVYDYNPSNPENPGKNYWNAETGEVIVDDFTPGNLYNAVYQATDGNYDQVQMITVAGPISQYDWGIVNNYGNCTFLDMSRTYGLTYVPSYNFSGNTTLTTVVLPSGIEQIEYYAFQGCSSLSSISIYASTPPTIGYRAFEGIGDSIVYVPADALALYQEAEGWKDFTILPLSNQVSALEVNLPEGTDPSIYKDMYIELVNTKSGQKQRYVITNRTTYTFSSLIHRTSYNVYLKNAQGDVLGEVDGIDIVDHDVSVTFESLMVPRDLTLQVLTPEGQDVTGQTTITWMDAKNTYLTKGNTLTGQLEGAKAKFRITLPQSLGMQYLLPADSLYEVQADNNISYTLTAIPQKTISGTVLDVKTGQPISGATVAISQMLNGLYSKAFTTKTDNTGAWSQTVYEAKTDITASMTDYVSKTQSFETLVAEVPAFELKDINGTTISLNLTYTTVDGETQSYYNDYTNVAYSIYNKTAGQQVTQMNVQYPQIVLMESLTEGTELVVTATSKNSKFVPVTATATVDSLDRANVTLPIVQLGGIIASFKQTDNNSIVGILYDSNNRLIKRYDYNGASLTISELNDGAYTLVTMANSQFFNSVATISQFAEAGLREGVDYVKNSITVKSGAYTAINNQMIPFLDETKLYYTGDNTSIAVNKSQITVGNYLTISSRLDFKNAYADAVSDVKLIVDLPEETSFVDNSVMAGSSTASYTYDNHKLIVPLTNYSDRVRFCFIPTVGGTYSPAASVQFALGGKEITQPIGNVNFTAKDLSISVPSTVAKTTVPVSGTAVGKSTVEIFDNGKLVGQTTSLANGSWATTVELDNPYNLSRHEIYAKLTTLQGVEMQSETRETTYDTNAIEIQKVTMFYSNPEEGGWKGKNYEIVWDFQNPSTTPIRYTYYIYNRSFTFTVDFTSNDTTKVSNVILYVKTGDGKWHPMETRFDKNKGKWVASGEFGNMYDGVVPVNVSVDYDIISDVVLDDRELTENKTELQNISDDYNSKISLLIEAMKDESGTAIDILANEMGISFVNEENAQELALDEEKLEAMTDEEFEAYGEDLEKEISAFLEDNQSFVENLMKFMNCDSTFVVTNEDGSCMTISNAQEFVGKDLIAEGYVVMPLTNGDSLFVNQTNTSLIMVDLTHDKVISISYEYESSEDSVEGKRASSRNVAILIRNAVLGINEAVKSITGFSDDLMNRLLQETSVIEKAGKDINWELGKAQNYFNKSKDPLKRIFWASKITAIKAQQISNSIALGLARSCRPLIRKVIPVMDYIDMTSKLIRDINTVGDLYLAVPEPCPAQQAKADMLSTQTISLIGIYAAYATGRVLLRAQADAKIATGIVAALPSGGTSLLASLWGLIDNVVLGVALDIAYEKTRNWAISELRNEISKLKCKDNPDPDPNPNPNNPNPNNPNPKPNGGDHQSGSPDGDVPIDPSGYVYEGVASNRVQGATATVYYKETVEDMYGDLHENVVLWNAEEYAQQNPLFTDENGMYRWDVPQGLWQVKFEKEGYQTTYSEWLPVPPPQLDVNIPMTQMLQPTVKGGKAFADGIEFEFDKYMDPESLTTDNIMVTKNGNAVTGEVKLLNEEVAYEGETQTYASKVRFEVPEGEELLSTDEVQLTVRKAVKSYAGVPMQDDYTQKFDIELQVRRVAVDSLINVAYGGTRTLTIAALPADAAKGKTMNVKSLSSMIATANAETLTLDENGQAELIVTGELPGSTVLNFAVEGTDVEGMMTVNVKDAEKLVAIAPRASRVSGTEVYRGTKIQLTSETENAVIYYTLDGSCPCDENNPNLLTYNPDEPIIIADDNVTIKAMATGTDLAASETVEFTYSLKKTTVGYQMPVGWTWISHNLENAVSADEFKDNANRIMSQTDELVKDPSWGFVGTLRELQPAVGYKVQLDAAMEKSLKGYEFNAVQNTVSVAAGWTWIGYPLNQTMTVNEALYYFNASTGDYIVGQEGFAEFDGNEWKGTLEGLKPGQSYLFKSATAAEISFNTNIVSDAVSRIGKRNLLMNSPWAYNYHAYPNLMPVTAELYADGSKADADDYLVGAFAGGECRGIGLWKDARLLMSVYGDNNEEIRFVAADLDNEKFYDITETLNFTADNQGSWLAPMALTIGDESTGMRELYNELMITPAVARDHITVNAGGRYISRLTITNLKGVTVLSINDLGTGGTVTTGSLQDGLYIVTVQAEGNTYYKKIIKANK